MWTRRDLARDCIQCRADKYTCPQLDQLSREFLRRNFEKVVQFDGQPPNRVGLCSLSQSALVQILTDDNLELSSEVSLSQKQALSGVCENALKLA